jgi:hypothetical protein
MRVIQRGLPLFALALLLLVACDGDDASGDGPTATPTPTPTVASGGRDADYVREFCTVEVAFETRLVMAAEQFLALGLDSLSDPEVLTEVLVPPLRTYIDDLRRVNPPSDVRPYHDDLIEAMEAQVQLIETGRFDAETLGDDPFADLVEPPAAIQTRLSQVAATAADCDGVSFFDP